MGGFLKFEKMITPVFIQVIFWVGLLGSIIAGLAQIGFAFFMDDGMFFAILTGVATMFIGPIIIRIYCEMLIVVFKMQSALTDIRNSMKDSPNGMRSVQEKQGNDPLGIE